jgi:hypothetical protein
LWQVFICLRPRTSYLPSPPLHIVNEYTVYVFTQGSREGRGGGESCTREKGRGATGECTDHKAGLKITTRLNVLKKLVISSL